MELPVEFLPEAAVEAAAARAWYQDQSPNAAAAFVAELDSAIERIAEASRLYPVYVAGTRRCLMRGFPFLVVYRVPDERVQVIAIAHGNRRPGYWKDRSV